MGKPKRGKKSKNDDWDDDDDDVANGINALSLKEENDSDDAQNGIESVPKPKKKEKKKKNLFMDLDVEEEKDDEDEDEDVGASVEDETPKVTVKETPKEQTNEAPKEPSRAKDPSEMTQDEIAAWLDGEYEEEDKKKKKKKKKEKQKPKEQQEVDDLLAAMEGNAAEQDEAQGEEDSTVKSAAQKKKEKKERQKQQKLMEKQKQQQKKPDTPEEKKEDVVVVVEEKEETPEPEAAGNDEGEAEDGDKKKKKKDRRKKKKGEEDEEDEKKKKKPSKMAKAIQEMQQKLREEEERLRKEEEEKERIALEKEREREEQQRKDKEKKEREKQKKKERIERLKAEGKYLTEKQKQDKQRAAQMLEAFKAQGVELPVPGEKRKKVVYERKKKKKSEPTTPAETPTEEKDAEIKVEEAKPELLEEKKDDVKEGDDVKDDWDAEDDVKDAWDAESEEEEEAEEAKDEKPSKKEQQDSDDDDESDEDESDDESSEESSDESSDEEDSYSSPRERAMARIEKRKEDAEKKSTTDILRAPVVCVLGHVDTGKTKILDKLRRTHVQDDEAGGITQQIGATNVPLDAILNQTKMCKEFTKQELKIPGLLIIDTPGHESFSNLRTRGSSLCDIAILVIDIMHGLEPQTIESINLLKKGKTPFIVALNKVDRLYQWQSNPHADIVNNLKKQKPNTKMEFDERTQSVIVQLAEQGLNACLFHENKNAREYVSMVPTSAHSGDGMGNLLALICELTQTLLAKRISFSEDLQATVMEVKAIQGLGTTIDVILVNGSIREGDTIILAGQEGPIVTQIRALLMPQPMKELRVKNAYNKYKEVVAAQGCKLIAKDLEKALAGLPLYVAQKPDEVEVYKEEIADALEDILGSIKLTERGVFVQASTLGSLEALLEFLRVSKIPYAGINIGPVHKRDIMKASVMLEHDSQWAVILAFDVKVEREAQEMADSLGVKIFTAEIIYHLFDKFMAHRDEQKKQKQEEFKHIAVFPCKIKILPQFIFNSRDPIVCGVEVQAGFLKEGTALCVPSKEFLEVGRVTSIENNHKVVPKATKGQEVCIKIEPIPGDAPKMIGRHFDETDILVSKISRQSIDAVKDYFREEMSKADWQLIMELKKTFEIL